MTGAGWSRPRASKWPVTQQRMDPFPGIAGAARPLLWEMRFLGLSLRAGDREPRTDTQAPLQSREGPGSRCTGRVPAGCRQRLMRGLLASGRVWMFLQLPPLSKGRSGLAGWGRRSCQLARRDCALLPCLTPGIAGPPTFRLGWPRVTRCQAPCSRANGPWAGPPTPATLGPTEPFLPAVCLWT